MLKVRVIPTLLWKNHGLVKGVGFDSWRRVGTVMPAIKVYNTREVDELILVDITASSERREPDYESLSDLSADCFVPLTVGGGIRGLEHVQKLLDAGADKVSINSAAYDNPVLIPDASRRFGSQCIVGSIDVVLLPNGEYRCSSMSGTRMHDINPCEWAAELERAGAGEILLTAVQRDGTMEGYDIELIRQVANSVSIPIIASGGAGNYDHMIAAVKEGGASAVAAGSIFHFTQQTPLEAKHAMARTGIPTRILVK
ncbi:MAG: imidazole glycerol phosphate synthase cyclase subunit [Verrucomicrobiota bacterium]